MASKYLYLWRKPIEPLISCFLSKPQPLLKGKGSSVLPIMVRFGRTLSKFKLFLEKISEKGLNYKSLLFRQKWWLLVWFRSKLWDVESDLTIRSTGSWWGGWEMHFKFQWTLALTWAWIYAFFVCFWYLISIKLVSKRYLIDTKWNLDL